MARKRVVTLPGTGDPDPSSTSVLLNGKILERQDMGTEPSAPIVVVGLDADTDCSVNCN